MFDKEESLWFLATFVLTPMGLFSGILFPFEYMTPAMQRIGSFFPQRWIARGIERIQATGEIMGALPELSLILGVSIILFILAIRKHRLNAA